MASTMKKQRTEAAPLRPATSLHRVLAAGVLQWLRVADAVRLLSACRALHHDASLAEYALVHCAKDGRHFFQQCPRDWFHVITTWRGDDQSERGDLSCTSCHEHDSGDCIPRSQSRVKMLSMVGALERQMDIYLENGGEADAIRALLAPLTPSSPATLESAVRGSTETLTHATAVRAPEKLSLLAAHWENIVIRCDDDQAGAEAAACLLCTSCVDAICGYREETEAFAKRFEELLARQEEIWERAGWSEADMCELAFNFQQAYYVKEPFYNTYVADSDDSGILRYLCSQGRLRLPTALCTPCELRAGECGPLAMRSRAMCRAFYQPFRLFLAKKNVHHVRHFDIFKHTTRSREGARALELVAGTSDEAIVGMYVLS